MPALRARGGTPVRRASAWLVPLLVLGCGEAQPGGWIGTQDCSVGIPPEQAPRLEIPPARRSLEQTLIAPTADGFSLQNFVLGPVGGFSCSAWRVDAHYVTGNGSLAPGAQPRLARPIELAPFECRAGDGRIYLLDGAGQADLRSLFINMTFSVWLAAGQATLVCTTRFQRQGRAPAADAGEEGLPAEAEGPSPVETGELPADAGTSPVDLDSGTEPGGNPPAGAAPEAAADGPDAGATASP
jgi:hypothetical protein